jgi:hypothetical protein
MASILKPIFAFSHKVMLTTIEGELKKLIRI